MRRRDLGGGLLAATFVAAGGWFYIAKPAAPAAAVTATAPTTLAQLASAASSVDEWAERWEASAAVLDPADRRAMREASIETLAAKDSAGALALACSEPSEELRTGLIEAALRGWAKEHPEAALDWASAQSYVDRGQAMAAVFHGAAANPERAIEFFGHASAKYPANTDDMGRYLISALTRLKHFAAAADFATREPEAAEKTENLACAYAAWTADDPTAAVTHAAAHLPEGSESRQAALTIALGRWADRDARGVVDYAMHLPATERSLALSIALPAWVARDAPDAAAWLDRFPPSPELDDGIAALANRSESLAYPQVALSWAEKIADPRLRARTLATVVQKWAISDRAAAIQYVETSPYLQDEDRPIVSIGLTPDFPTVTLLP